MVSDADVQTYRRDGYLRIKGVFPAQETVLLRRRIEEIRQRAIAEKRVNSDPRYPDLTLIVGDVLGMQELKDQQYVILDERITRIAKALLGDRVVYFGDSSIQTGDGIRGYHKDNIDRDNPDGLDWKGDYTLAQFGIYLQDHANHGGGLKLRVGSHNFVSRRKGRPINVPSEMGDVLVWSSRMTHSGNVVRCRLCSQAVLPPRLEHFVPRFLRVRPEHERMVIFVTYAAPGPHVNRYIEQEATREDCRQAWKRSCVNPEIRALASSRGIELRLPIPDYGALHPLHQG